MLSECQVGDWVKYQPNPPKGCARLGIVTGISHDKVCQIVDFKCSITNSGNYILPSAALKEIWSSYNPFFNPYQPTIEELFKIKQLHEKD